MAGEELESIIDEALHEARQTLLAQGDLAHAEELLGEVLAVRPSHAEALGLMGVVAHRCGHAAEAGPLLAQGPAAGAAAPLVWQAQAERHAAAADFDEASLALARAVEPPGAPALWWRQHGQCLVRLGDLGAAVASFQRAVSLTPEAAEAWVDLGAARARLARLDEAAQALATALRLTPRHPVALGNLAGVRARQGEADEAVTLFEQAIAVAPREAWLFDGLAQAQDERGQPAAALAALEQGFAVAPLAMAVALGRQALRCGRANRALEVAQEKLQQQPWHAGAIDVQRQALTALGTPVSADLTAIERLRPDLGTAPREFCAALAEHVINHPTLVHAPHGHATKGGWHSGSLRRTPRGPITRLEAILEPLVQARARTSGFAMAGGRVMLNLWGVVFRGEGHQLAHIHPDAWLSGVFYARLPPGMHAPEAQLERQGWLRFLQGSGPEAAVLAEFEPHEGDLLLFPAHVHHATVPCPLPEPRVSVAFDVVPLG